MARRDQFWQGGHGEVGRGLLRRGGQGKAMCVLVWSGAAGPGMARRFRYVGFW